MRLADRLDSQDHPVRYHSGRPDGVSRLGRSASLFLTPSVPRRHDSEGFHLVRALPDRHDWDGDTAVRPGDQAVQGTDFERTECRHADVAVAEDDLRGLVRRVRVLGCRHGFRDLDSDRGEASTGQSRLMDGQERRDWIIDTLGVEAFLESPYKNVFLFWCR